MKHVLSHGDMLGKRPRRYATVPSEKRTKAFHAMLTESEYNLIMTAMEHIARTKRKMSMGEFLMFLFNREFGESIEGRDMTLPDMCDKSIHDLTELSKMIDSMIQKNEQIKSEYLTIEEDDTDGQI